MAAGDVTVTRTTLTTTTPDGVIISYLYTVRFSGAYAGQNLAPMTTVGSNGVTSSVSTVADGGIGTIVANGATLQLDIPAGGTVTGEAITLNGAGVGGRGARTT